MNQRMKVMAIERDKMRARASPRWARSAARAKLRQAPKGFMQQHRRQARSARKFDNEELREKLKMAGLRGQAPLVAYMFFRVAVPILMFIGALFYLFVVIDDRAIRRSSSVLIAHRRRLPRLLSAERVHPEPGSEAPVVHQAGVSRRARHAADLRAVGHVDRSRRSARLPRKSPASRSNWPRK